MRWFFYALVGIVSNKLLNFVNNDTPPPFGANNPRFCLDCP